MQPEMADEILDMIESLPRDLWKNINVSEDITKNYVIRVDTCSDTYMGNRALALLGNYVQLYRSTAANRAYAKRDRQEIDLERVIEQQRRATRYRHSRFIIPPMAGVDHFSVSYEPTGWESPPRNFMIAPITEAGGDYDPRTCFVPRSIEPYVWSYEYMDPRGDYPVHW